MSQVHAEQKDFVFYIKLNRPEKRNAFHPEMIDELRLAFVEAQNSSARVVNLSGAGQSFCAGADLAWMQSMVNFSMQENLEDSMALFAMFEAAKNCTKPIVAKVHGHVMGGAIGLVAIADIVAAEKGTKFAFSEVKLGLSPAVISPFVLSKMSASAAHRYMLTGEVFSAEEAQASGLVHFVAVNVDKFINNQNEVFKNNGPEAVEATKGLLKKIKSLSWSESLKYTTEVIAKRRVSAEGQEGLSGFLDKKPISWKLK